MVSTRRPSQAGLVASNALPADGGCTFADVPNAVTSAAAIVHQVSTRRNTTPPRVIRSSRASSRASIGFTTIARKNFSTGRSFTPLIRIRWISRRLDRPERCLQTGKRCFTNRGGCLVQQAHADGAASIGVALASENQRSHRCGGKVNCRMVPRGSAAAAHNFPPCASMIVRQMDRPIPKPSGLVV